MDQDLTRNERMIEDGHDHSSISFKFEVECSVELYDEGWGWTFYNKGAVIEESSQYWDDAEEAYQDARTNAGLNKEAV